MKIAKIAILIIFSAVFSGGLSASVDDELNPVDVISDEIATEEKSLIQQVSLQMTDLLIPANLVSSTGKKADASILLANDASRKLWETTISIVNENEAQNTAELQQAIEKINSLQFAKSQIIQPVQSESEPVESVQQVEEAPEPEEEAVIPAETAAVIDANEKIAENEKKAIAKALANIEKHISEVETPYEMAELLFHAGYLKQASAYYKQALKSGSYEGRPQDKAWILFQIGNCLKESSPAEAVKYYARLQSEYPDSTWAKAAHPYGELLELKMKSKPDELIKQQADELRKADSNE